MNAVMKLTEYALENELIRPEERLWAQNSILDALRCDALPPVEAGEGATLAETLDALTEDACARGVTENSVVYRDLLDTELMGRLTPRPGQVIDRFRRLYAEDPEMATDWYYRFSQNTNYIRRDRIAKDVK